MRRRQRADYAPFPEHLLAPDAELVRHDEVYMLSDHLARARWSYVDYLRARRERRLANIER